MGKNGLKGVRTSAGVLGVGTGVKMIRGKCMDCVGGEEGRVRGCRREGCGIWGYRMGGGPGVGGGVWERRTPVRAVRAFCLWCTKGDVKLVRECGMVGCSLWAYRLGRV